MLFRAGRSRVLGWLLALLGAAAQAAEYFLQRRRGEAALWGLIAILCLIQLLQDRITFPVRRALTTATLVGLAALSAWGTVGWFDHARYAPAAVTAYATLAFAGVAVWSALVWRPAVRPSFPLQSPAGAIFFVIVAGLLLLGGIDELSIGEVFFAILVWVTAALAMALGLAALYIQRQMRRQVEIAERLGFEDLHAYHEARSREGVSLDQMATETGLSQGQLERASTTWKQLRLRKERMAVG
jgi:hypothetical protein